MEYKFATERQKYADLASGRVFYSLPGSPAFPVRLASEVYQRCLALRGQADHPCTIYDPCCGAAYHLCTIAYLHWDSICRVIGSDIRGKAVQMAERNLSLLSPEGIKRRHREISAMVRLYHKDSHQEALESVSRMQEQVNLLTAVRPVQVSAFKANATEADSLQVGLQDAKIDVVFSDIPYGSHSQWEQTGKQNPVWAILDALLVFLSPESIVAVASDKIQKIAHEKYQRLERIKIGNRQVVILRPAG